jgi:hypothetical protein
VWDCKCEFEAIDEFDEECLHLEHAVTPISKQAAATEQDLCKRGENSRESPSDTASTTAAEAHPKTKLSKELRDMTPQHRRNEQYEAHKLEKTPTLIPFFVPVNHLSGLKTSGSGPNISSFLV